MSCIKIYIATINNGGFPARPRPHSGMFRRVATIAFLFKKKTLHLFDSEFNDAHLLKDSELFLTPPSNDPTTKVFLCMFEWLTHAQPTQTLFHNN